MPLPTFYATGTASVANGATTVTFSGALLGTAADPTIQAGDLFLDPAQPAVPGQRIASVDYDAGTAELWANWPGTTMSSDAYEVRYVGDIVRSTAQTRGVLTELSTVQANGRGLFYVFDDSTTDSDPGAGKLRINAATFAASTGGYIDNLDANGATASAIIDSWDDSGQVSGRGQLWVRSIATPSIFAALEVTGSVVDGTGYRKLAWTYVGGSGSLAAGDEIMVMFVPVGAKGSNAILGDWQGEWATATAYAADDLVEKDGSTYICLAGHTSGTFSTDLAAGKWELAVEKGDHGEQGIQGDPGLIGDWQSAWTTATAYAVNDAVQHNGSGYICLVGHTSGAFAIDLAAGKWDLVVSKGGDGASGIIAPADRTALKALDTSTNKEAFLKEPGREGTFVFRSGDYSSLVTADTREGIYIKADDTASSSGAWVRQGNWFFSGMSVVWFGTDGVDDQPAIQAAIDLQATISAPVSVPEGTFVLGSTITVGHSGARIIGAGPYATVLEGDFADGDILYVGDDTTAKVNIHISGLRLASSVSKTSGAALHGELLGRCLFEEIVADGQDGNGNLYHGFWFDKVDKVALSHFEAVAQEDAIRLNGAIGSGPKADFSLHDGKVGASGVGIHVGGAFGGTYFTELSIIGNTTNVLIDTTLAAEVNREIMFSPTVVIDGGTTGVQISDTLGSTSAFIQFEGVWIASASDRNVDIDASVAHTILFSGCRVYNAGSDGIRIQSSDTTVLVAGGQIYANGGWGVNLTASNPDCRVELPLMAGNTSGDLTGVTAYSIRGTDGGVGVNSAPEAGLATVFGSHIKAKGTVQSGSDVNAYALKAGRYSSGFSGAAIDTDLLATFLELQVQTGTVARFSQGGAVTFPNVGTTASGANAVLNSGASNSLLRSTSSLAYKRDIEPVDLARARALLRLSPIWYRSKAPADNPEWSWYGFAAEEVAAIDPRLVAWGYREGDYEEVVVDGVRTRQLRSGAVAKPDGVAYDRLPVLQHALIKELHETQESLREELDRLSQRLENVLAAKRQRQ